MTVVLVGLDSTRTPYSRLFFTQLNYLSFWVRILLHGVRLLPAFTYVYTMCF